MAGNYSRVHLGFEFGGWGMGGGGGGEAEDGGYQLGSKEVLPK